MTSSFLKCLNRYAEVLTITSIYTFVHRLHVKTLRFRKVFNLWFVKHGPIFSVGWMGRGIYRGTLKYSSGWNSH